MAINYNGLMFRKGPTRALERHRRKLDEAKLLKECYAAVDARDGWKCRVCDSRVVPGASSWMVRGERHHMVYRSRGGLHKSWNVITLCIPCHEQVHLAGALRVKGDANQRNEDTGRLDGVKVERRIGNEWVFEKWV